VNGGHGCRRRSSTAARLRGLLMLAGADNIVGGDGGN